MAQVLDQLRIVDFTSGISGPMACGLLAQHGAEVIKVETPAGDRMADDPGYLTWNANKQVIILDLASEPGRSAALNLIASADLAVFDTLPGELERQGFDAATLCANDPTLIHVWMPPYSEHGEWKDLPPSDALLSAVTSAAFSQASYEDRPVWLVTPQLSYSHAILTAGVVSAALYERLHSGLGQSVVVTGLRAMGAARTGAAIYKEGMMRMGAGRGGARGLSPNYRLYQCGDGEWLFLGTLSMPFFLKALQALDLVELLAEEGVDGEIANLQQPPHNLTAIARLDARFAEKPRDEWLRLLKANDAPAGPVGERSAWFAGEQVAANTMRVEFEDAKLGRVSVPGVSIKLSEAPGAVRALPERITEPPARQTPKVQPRTATTLMGSAQGALAGVRIIDLGVVIAGPFGPAIMANYGADVIKVEPFDGDSFRSSALSFANWNRSKRGVAMDLKHPDGYKAFLELVKTVDVVEDNFRLGVRERLKIDFATLSKVNPRIITCSMMGYGPTGPFAADPGFDPILQARSGLMAMQGGDDEPVFHSIPVNDQASGLMGAYAMTLGLIERERTGRGLEIWTSLTNQSIVSQSGEVVTYAGRPAPPKGGRDCVGVSAARRFYPTADGWIGIDCASEPHLDALAGVTGMAPNTLRDAPAEGGVATAVAARFASRDNAGLVAELLAAGVPAAPALRTEAMYQDPWFNANDFWEDYDLPGMGEVRGLRGYARWSRSRGGFSRPAPQHGAHTLEVLAEAGFSPEELQRLQAVQAIRQR